MGSHQPDSFPHGTPPVPPKKLCESWTAQTTCWAVWLSQVSETGEQTIYQQPPWPALFPERGRHDVASGQHLTPPIWSSPLSAILQYLTGAAPTTPGVHVHRSRYGVSVGAGLGSFLRPLTVLQTPSHIVSRQVSRGIAARHVGNENAERQAGESPERRVGVRQVQTADIA